MLFLTILSVLILFFAALILGGLYFSEPGYEGPKSDHFDGKYFHNPDHNRAKELAEVIKWSASRKPRPWVKNYETYVRSEPIREAPSKEVLVTFVNHSTFLLQTGKKNILIDPVWSERVSPLRWAGPRRMRPPGVGFDKLPAIDLVLITHNHYDHLDLPTIKKLEHKYQPQFVVPLGVKRMLEKKRFKNLIEIDWWDETEIHGFTIQPTPANHFSGRGLKDRNRTLWCGYLIKNGSFKILYIGDTGYGDTFKKIGERTGGADIVFIPIGAYEPRWFMSPIHISPAEAVKVHQDVQSSQSIAMHFGTFPLADEGTGTAQKDLAISLERAGISPEVFIIPEEGKTYTFHSQRN